MLNKWRNLKCSGQRLWVSLAVLLSLVGFNSSGIAASPLPSAPAKIYPYQLQNGLTLIVKPDSRAPVVFTSIWYKVGGSYENDGMTGISHVLEHMMFRGTKHFPPGALEKIIAANGGQQNAMTTADQTVYYQSLSADKLPIAFKLEADRMHNLLLSEATFKKEIQVVMEERRMRIESNPQAVLWERFMAAAHVNNPYHHPVVGWMTDLKHLTIADVRKWYKQWYVPNNAVVIVVGDVKPQAVRQLAEHYFGNIKSRTLPVIKPRREIPALGKKTLNVYLPAKLPWLIMGYQVPTLKTATKQWQPYALDVLAAILAGSDSSRLVKDLVRHQQVASSISADYDPFQLHSDMLAITATPSTGVTVAKLQQHIAEEMHRLRTQLVSPAELQRIKAQVIASKVFSLDSLRQQAFTIGTPVSIDLPWKLATDFSLHIQQVTAQQIQQVAQRYLQPQRLTVAILHPLTKNRKEGADS